MIELIGAAGVAVAIGSGLARSITTVSQKHFAIVDWFGYRFAGYLEEGPHPVPPFSDVTEYSLELATKPIKVVFFSGDKLEVRAEGSVQWRPDPGVQYYRDDKGRRVLCEPDENGRVLFVEMSEETILSGTTDAIEEQLGIVAGTEDADAFIEKREAIGLLINAILRLDKDRIVPFTFDTICSDSAKREELKRLLSIEKDIADERSEREKRFGVDIELFALSKVRFSEKTEVALQEKQQVVAQLRAKGEQATVTHELVKKFKEEGLTPQEAFNAAAQVVGIGNVARQIHSIEGIRPLVEIVRMGGS